MLPTDRGLFCSPHRSPTTVRQRWHHYRCSFTPQPWLPLFAHCQKEAQVRDSGAAAGIAESPFQSAHIEFSLEAQKIFSSGKHSQHVTTAPACRAPPPQPSNSSAKCQPRGQTHAGLLPGLCSFSVWLFWGQDILKAPGDSVSQRSHFSFKVAHTYHAVPALSREPLMVRVLGITHRTALKGLGNGILLYLAFFFL